MQVPSELTHLQVIAPRPHNTSAELPTPIKIRDLVRPKGGWVRYIFKNLYSFISNKDKEINDNENSNSNNNQETNNLKDLSEVDAEFDFNANNTNNNITSSSQTQQSSSSSATSSTSSEITKENIIEKSASSTIARTIYEVTDEQWDSYMTPYVEPQHLSFRTTQIQSLGFNVDHLAMLWCKQLLSVITKIMKKLTQLKSTDYVNMTNLVRYKSDHVADLYINADNYTNHSAVIQPIREYLYRNQSHYVFGRTSVDVERKSFFNQLNKSYLSTFGVIYITHYLINILTCYIIIGLLVMATQVFYDLCDKKSHPQSFIKPNNDLEYLLPANHLFLGSFEDILFLIIPTSLFPILSSLFFPSLIGLISISLGYFFVNLNENNFPTYIRLYGPFFQWIISYGAALIIHFTFVIILSSWRFICSTIFTIIWIILRYTIWCDLIRKPIRNITKPIRKLFRDINKVVTLELFLFIISISSLLVTLVMIKSSSNIQQNSISNILLLTSILYVIASVQLIGVYFFGFSTKSLNSSPLLTTALALALPVLILMLPSLFFSLSIVISSLTHRETQLSETFELFGPELINYTLAIFFTGYTLLFLQW